jgi:hypothetical protein
VARPMSRISGEPGVVLLSGSGAGDHEPEVELRQLRHFVSVAEEASAHRVACGSRPNDPGVHAPPGGPAWQIRDRASGPSVGKDLAQDAGESVRFAAVRTSAREESAVAAGEGYRRGPEPFGHGHGPTRGQHLAG